MKRAIVGVGISVEAAMARGARIRALRVKRGLSQLEVAAQTGMDVSTVFRVEQTGKVTERTAQRLAPVLGVSVKELVGAK